MKLGVVTTSYPRFAGDASGSFVAGHVAALRARGHAVHVIAAGEPADEPADEPDVTRVGGAGLFYAGGAPDALERAPVRAAPSAIAFTARLAAAVTAHARAWDGVIAHWLVPSALAALPSGKPLLAIAHGGDVYTLRRLHLLAPALHLLHRRDARLVFVSAQLRAVARAAVPALADWLDRATVQPMGIDLARFTALERAPSDPPIILIAARLVPIKGIDIALAALPHVTHAARLVIAGDGPLRARLDRGDPRVEWLGQVTSERRDQLLRAASVVVIPSRTLPSGRTEGAPMIALEALAAGVPVVASAVGGLCELPAVQLVPPGDPRALAAAIDRVLADPPTSADLRKSVVSFDWREAGAHLVRE